MLLCGAVSVNLVMFCLHKVYFVRRNSRVKFIRVQMIDTDYFNTLKVAQLLYIWLVYILLSSGFTLPLKMASKNVKNNISLEESSDDESIFITQTARDDLSPVVNILDQSMMI